jgi:hypothetical protein
MAPPWKGGLGQPIEGSNPSLSAKQKDSSGSLFAFKTDFCNKHKRTIFANYQNLFKKLHFVPFARDNNRVE